MKTSMPFGSSFISRAMLVLAAVLISTQQLSAEQPAHVPSPDQNEVDTPPSATGLRAFYDPVTGTYTATDETPAAETLAAALEKALSRSTEGLQTFTLEHGGHGVHLDGRFQSAVVAYLNNDGTLEFRCTHDHDELEAHLHSPQKPGTHSRKPLFEDM